MKTDLTPTGAANNSFESDVFVPKGGVFNCLPKSSFRGRSVHYATNNLYKKITFSLIVLSVIGAMAALIVGATLIPAMEDLQAVVEAFWWDIIQFFLLILTAAGPVYLASAAEERRLKKEGDFRGRVLVSLNQVQDDDPSGPVFCMRSLAEMSFQDFFPDDYVQWVVTRAQDNVGMFEGNDMSTHRFGPFLQFKTTYADWKRIRDHVKNRLSSLSPGGFLARDMGVPVVEVEYAWALAYEQSGQRDELNNKFRVMLVRKDLLERVAGKDAEEVPPAGKEYLDDKQVEYFARRWKTLQLFAELLPTSRQNQLMMETIMFAMPLANKQAAPAWTSWTTSEMNLINVKVD